MTETTCKRCSSVVDVQTEKCWFYSWEEQPSEEMVETAIEKDDFRDWFQDNHILCQHCHRELQQFMQGGQ